MHELTTNSAATFAVIALVGILSSCAHSPAAVTSIDYNDYEIDGADIVLALPFDMKTTKVWPTTKHEPLVKTFYRPLSVADFGLTTGKRSISSIMIFLTEMSFEETVAYHNSKLKPSAFWWMPQDEAKAKEVLPNGFLTGIRPRHPFRRRIEFEEWYYVARYFIFELENGRTFTVRINTNRAVAGRDETHYIRHADEIFERVYQSIRTTDGERIYKPVDEKEDSPAN